MSKEFITTNGYMDNETVDQLSPELKELWNKVFICRSRIENILRSKAAMVGKVYWGFNADASISAYLLAKASEFANPFSVEFEYALTIVDGTISDAAQKYEIGNSWKELLELVKEFPTNVFYLVANLKDMSNPSVTPDSICQLADELLSLEKNETFADMCCGTGSFVTLQRNRSTDSKLYGYDVSADCIAMAQIYNDTSDSDIEYSVKDVFELALDNEEIKFDKIFANYPLGMRLNSLSAGREYLEQLEKRIPSMSKATSSDWLFNLLMMDMLEDNGKAVSVMTNGSTWNMIDAPIRKYFVENGFVECVIALPPKMFSTTGVSTSMIVLSRNNAGVRLIDATDIYVPGRRVNELSDKEIDVIIQMTKSDSEKSKFISLEELRDNDYVLNTSRYTGVSENVKDGAAFGSVIKRITRGAQLNARDFDVLSTAKPTEVQYLMLANVHNGLIDKDLPYLTTLDPKNEKYCLTNHCIILSKNGYPYKIAVAEIKKGQKILANGNLYIIELDEEKADPYYIAAFLGSEQGTAALKSITVGATIPNIGVEQLKKLIIPIPSLEQQNEIAAKYQAYKDEIAMLQLKIERTKSKLAHIFEEGGN